MKLKINELKLTDSFIHILAFQLILALCMPQTTNANQISFSSAGFIPHLGQHNDAAPNDKPETHAKPSAPAPSSQETQAAFAAQGAATKSSQMGTDAIGLVSSGSDSAVQPLPGITFQTSTADSTSQTPSTDNISNMNNLPSQSLLGSTTNTPAAAFTGQLSEFHQDDNPASVPASIRDDPDMKGVCQSTQYPDVCISSVAPLLSGKPNVISILQMAIKACEVQTKITTAFAKRLASSSVTHTSNDEGISACEDKYRDIMDNLKIASDAIRTRDVGTINSMLSAVISDLYTCEDGFYGHPSPMVQFLDRLKKMSSNCLAISKLVK